MTPDPIPLVSVRRDQIAFNAHFVSSENLERKSHVSVFPDSELYRLGFKFHDSPEDDAYALTSDGGGSGGRGRCFQVAALMRDHLWLAAVANIEDSRLRRFKPKWISTDAMWVISLSPAFEHRVSDRSDIPSQTRGIYRYKRGDDIVYIGRGQVRSRLGSKHRAEWDFETIEYSLVADEAHQAKWETFWLDRFVEQYGKLPLYNRISGARSIEPEDGQKAGAANGSQPIRSETNRTSSAAGSRR